MKILFVCMQYVHSARWINQLKDSEHQIYLFDCLDKPIHKDLLWTNYTTNWSKRKIPYIKGEYYLEKNYKIFFDKIKPFLKVTASEKLQQIITEIKPDLVHSLEFQSETYPLLKVKKKYNFNWAAFSWGSDLFFYKNKKKHQKKIKSILNNINYFFSDNTRDQIISKGLGFTNKGFIFPGGGGYNLDKINSYKIPIEERNLILIKGYHHWAGRALTVLNALELIIDKISDYNIYVYSAHKIVIDKIEELNKKYNLKIKYSSRYNEISQDNLIQKFGAAKIAIGNNISDGIPNTLLEAIICGAFPIQSNPGSVTEEYINDGENGFLIENPENLEEIASKIRKALNDDVLLENAFRINKSISEKLEYSKIKKAVLKAYKEIEGNL